MALKSLSLSKTAEDTNNETKQARSLLGRIRLTMDTSPLGANFRRYGPSFGAYEYDAFIAMAKMFYKDAQSSSDPRYSVVELSGNRTAIDYNGETRGIYTHKGKPLAFFRPDYAQSGFKSKQEEIQAFRDGRI